MDLRWVALEEAVAMCSDGQITEAGGIGPCARLRLTAPVTDVGPGGVDPATGRTFARLLAARWAHERWGIPRTAAVPVTELRATGT